MTGRKTDTIVSGGENVAPAEVEAVLLEHPAVAEAGVFARAHPEWGEAVTARVVLRTDATEAELRAWAGERLARFKVPKAIEVADRASAHRIGQAASPGALVTYRQENRRRWQTVADGWEKHADAFRRDTMPVSMWMLEALAPQPGQTLLELAAGVGDTGFLAAELIEPGGTLITSDLVPEMLSAAQRRAEQLGIHNVRFRQIDAEAIDQPAASLDGVLSRWGYMLMPDAEAALRDTRRVLRPGGRLALAAWTDPADNPWTVLPLDELVDRGLVEPVPPGPGQFAWAPEGTVEENLEAAGFVEYEVVSLPFTIRYESVEAWWQRTADMSLRVHERASRAQDDEILGALAERARDWTADDGSLAVPARTWVAAATA